MKFGHYTNAELGIRRNLTCAMFDSKGVSVGDAQCSTQPLTGQALRKHLEDLFNKHIGYSRSGSVNWHDYIADYVNEFESDGSTAKANNVLTQFDIQAKEILRQIQAKNFPAGTDMHAALVQMKLIIVSNRAALKRELRSMRMSNDLDEQAKDVECAKGDNYKDRYKAYLYDFLHVGEYKNMKEFAKWCRDVVIDEIQRHPRKYKNVKVTKKLAQEILKKKEPNTDVNAFLKDLTNGSRAFEQDDKSMLKKGAKQIVDEFWKAFEANMPYIQKVVGPESVDKSKIQHAVKEFADYVDDEVRTFAEEASGRNWIGDAKKAIAASKRFINEYF